MFLGQVHAGLHVAATRIAGNRAATNVGAVHFELEDAT